MTRAIIKTTPGSSYHSWWKIRNSFPLLIKTVCNFYADPSQTMKYHTSADTTFGEQNSIAQVGNSCFVKAFCRPGEMPTECRPNYISYLINQLSVRLLLHPQPCKVTKGQWPSARARKGCRSLPQSSFQNSQIRVP